ncbi:MAG: hypothetical protein R2932_59810 [Caldilineaceae bacterium]
MNQYLEHCCGVIQQLWPDDAVMTDFVTYVVPLLSDQLGHVTAKGGDFVLTQLAEGANADKVSRYAHDQSMRAHLINGLSRCCMWQVRCNGGLHPISLL